MSDLYPPSLCSTITEAGLDEILNDGGFGGMFAECLRFAAQNENEKVLFKLLKSRRCYYFEGADERHDIELWRAACRNPNKRIMRMLINFFNAGPSWTLGGSLDNVNQIIDAIRGDLKACVRVLLDYNPNAAALDRVMSEAIDHNPEVISILAHFVHLDLPVFGRDRFLPIEKAAERQAGTSFIQLVENGASTDIFASANRGVFSDSRWSPYQLRTEILIFLSGVVPAPNMLGVKKDIESLASVLPNSVLSYERDQRAISDALCLSSDGDNLHDECRQRVRQVALDNILYDNAFAICIGLQSLELPALVTVCILQARFSKWPNIPFGLLYDYVTTVKHHNDPATHATKKRRK